MPKEYHHYERFLIEIKNEQLAIQPSSYVNKVNDVQLLGTEVVPFVLAETRRVLDLLK